MCRYDDEKVVKLGRFKFTLRKIEIRPAFEGENKRIYVWGEIEDNIYNEFDGSLIHNRFKAYLSDLIKEKLKNGKIVKDK